MLAKDTKFNSISRPTVIKYSDLVTSRVENQFGKFGEIIHDYIYGPKSLEIKYLFEQYIFSSHNIAQCIYYIYC